MLRCFISADHSSLTFFYARQVVNAHLCSIFTVVCKFHNKNWRPRNMAWDTKKTQLFLLSMKSLAKSPVISLAPVTAWTSEVLRNWPIFTINFHYFTIHMELDKETLVYRKGPEHRETTSILAGRKEFFIKWKTYFILSAVAGLRVTGLPGTAARPGFWHPANKGALYIISSTVISLSLSEATRGREDWSAFHS